MKEGLWLFVVLGVIGIYYMIYSFIYRNKITLYTKSNIPKYTIANEGLFLRAQLYVGLINGMFILVTSVLLYLYQLSNPKINVYPFMCLVPFAFHMINYTFLYYAERKGYIVKKK